MKRIAWILFILLLSVTVHAQEKNAEGNFIFLFVGDGMGLAHINATQLYLSAIEGKEGLTDLSFTDFPYTALASNYAENRSITGSAASATALATGKKTTVDRISVSPDGMTDYQSLSEAAISIGMKTAVISSVSLDHATPAAFYAHRKSRSDYFMIGHDMVTSNIDFFGGGGLLRVEGSVDGVKVNLWELAEENGFFLADTYHEIDQQKKIVGRMILTAPRLDRSMAMPYAIDSSPEDITLERITQIAVDRLENENGFFIMVEGGKIDWASHARDVGTTVQEVLAFSDAVEAAVEFYQKHPERTTIIVTADHETGGLAIGRQETRYEFHPERLKYQKVSYMRLAEIIQEFRSRNDNIEENFQRFMRFLGNDLGLGRDDRIPLNDDEVSHLEDAFASSMAGGKDEEGHDVLLVAIIKTMNLKAGIGWSSDTHTGINVPVFAIGRGAEKFSGMIDQTEVSDLVRELME